MHNMIYIYIYLLEGCKLKKVIIIIVISIITIIIIFLAIVIDPFITCLNCKVLCSGLRPFNLCSNMPYIAYVRTPTYVMFSKYFHIPFVFSSV